MKTITLYFLGFLAICSLLYASYWGGKNVSYWLWYEDMVKDTIREMVKQEALTKTPND